jgi:5-methylthioadenosine/S-adenosylhomocysteine deaminase
MSILIRNALLNGKEQDLYIEQNTITKIGKNLKEKAEQVLEAKHKTAIPSFFNAHTHAAMTLFRGYADDMQLQEWLETRIWPLEAKLTEKDVYAGAKLACLEMIKSGTTFFNDMYWHWHGTAKAVQEMGIRAAISGVFIDLQNEEKARQQIELNKRLYKESRFYPGNVIFALGPHSVYTVREESLLWLKDFADKNRLLLHIHLSETKKEVDDCIKQHGMRPVEYLQKIGFLGPNVVACHSVWLDRKEIQLLAEHQVKIAHNPTSNMKLAVGAAIKFEEMKKIGLTVALGTDGCASNNNLDMLEEMKIAALLQKFAANRPIAMAAKEAFDMATCEGAKAFGINAGVIEEGRLADLLLVDIRRPELCPNHDLISNLVYSANGSCVDTTICDGKILMLEGRVEGEEKIMDDAEKAAKDLVMRK